tara:strand:+ start:2612 stop:3382 length:771 start_codon:yes stop_codon:yes gene_type:complete
MNIRLFKVLPLKINGFIFLFSLLVFALLIKLGLWQLDRAEQKDLRLEKMQLYQQQASMNLNDILKRMAQKGSVKVGAKELNDLPVSLSGTFDNKHKFLLDNQVYKGGQGYRVIQLFRDEISGVTVLVNLGWVHGGIDRSYIPEIPDITGQVEFSGKIRVMEPSMVLEDEVLQSSSWPQRIQSIDNNKISQLLAKPLLPFIVYVDNDDSLGYIKEWVPIVMPPEKHRGYAFQWFSLAIAWFILMLSASYKSASKNEQ